MKKKSFKIVAFIALAIIIYACDKVEGPYIEGNPYSGEYDSDLPIRKILLEDFTGFGCVNCPSANEEIHKLQDRYGKHIVPIAIHSGWFATPIAGDDPDYRTTVGEELGGNGNNIPGFFNVQTQPIGVLNRKKFNEDWQVEYEEWSGKIVEILSENKFADVDVTIEPSYNSDTKEVQINVSSKAIVNVDAKLSLAVYIVESNVIGKQKDGSETIEDYQHNHMLRAGVNGTWGEEISTTIPFEAGEELSNAFTYTLDDDWNASNCEIIAFVFNTESIEVIQAEQAPVISE